MVTALAKVQVKELAHPEPPEPPEPLPALAQPLQALHRVEQLQRLRSSYVLALVSNSMNPESRDISR